MFGVTPITSESFSFVDIGLMSELQVVEFQGPACLYEARKILLLVSHYEMI